jgi:hypothetical protein
VSTVDSGETASQAFRASTLEAANRMLEEVYVSFWNERFAKAPVDPAARAIE